MTQCHAPGQLQLRNVGVILFDHVHKAVWQLRKARIPAGQYSTVITLDLCKIEELLHTSS
jgi:hypothetical protein